MTCSDEPIADLPTGCGPAPKEYDYQRVFDSMCGLHYGRFANGEESERTKQAARSFATRFLQVWQSGGIRPLFSDIVDCATKVIDFIEKNPKASISAHNIRLIAGQHPKFSKRLRAKL